VTRYRSATVADSNGIPRPLSAHASARAEANFSNNEAVNVPRAEFPVNAHERQQLPPSAATATLHSAGFLSHFTGMIAMAAVTAEILSAGFFEEMLTMRMTGLGSNLTASRSPSANGQKFRNGA